MKKNHFLHRVSNCFYYEHKLKLPELHTRNQTLRGSTKRSSYWDLSTTQWTLTWWNNLHFYISMHFTDASPRIRNTQMKELSWFQSFPLCQTVIKKRDNLNFNIFTIKNINKHFIRSIGLIAVDNAILRLILWE